MSLVRPLAVHKSCLMQSLAAVVEQYSISPLSSLYPLHPSFLPSLQLPPDSNDAGKIVEWSQRPTSATSESKTDREGGC